ncbi:MAG TPA: hypothetical protein VEU62_23690 [Bryobacterales bacterium]|nr:hypothetical protein [Bryobacterales bacterium]
MTGRTKNESKSDPCKRGTNERHEKPSAPNGRPWEWTEQDVEPTAFQHLAAVTDTDNNERKGELWNRVLKVGTRGTLDGTGRPMHGSFKPLGLAGSDQIVDRIARLKGWIELDKGIGPQQTGFKAALHVLTDFLVTNMDEAADVLGVVGYQSAANFEEVQSRLDKPRCVIRLNDFGSNVPEITKTLTVSLREASG